MSIHGPTERLMCWRLWLYPFDLWIIHRHGSKKQVPDAVSKLRDDNELGYSSDDDEIPCFELTTVLAAQTRHGTLTNADPTHQDPAAHQIEMTTQLMIYRKTQTTCWTKTILRETQ